MEQFGKTFRIKNVAASKVSPVGLCVNQAGDILTLLFDDGKKFPYHIDALQDMSAESWKKKLPDLINSLNQENTWRKKHSLAELRAMAVQADEFEGIQDKLLSTIETLFRLIEDPSLMDETKRITITEIKELIREFKKHYGKASYKAIDQKMG